MIRKYAKDREDKQPRHSSNLYLIDVMMRFRLDYGEVLRAMLGGHIVASPLRSESQELTGTPMRSPFVVVFTIHKKQMREVEGHIPAIGEPALAENVQGSVSKEKLTTPHDAKGWPNPKFYPTPKRPWTIADKQPRLRERQGWESVEVYNSIVDQGKRKFQAWKATGDPLSSLMNDADFVAAYRVPPMVPTGRRDWAVQKTGAIGTESKASSSHGGVER